MKTTFLKDVRLFLLILILLISGNKQILAIPNLVDQ